MTDTEAALAYLREQFGEGWVVRIHGPYQTRPKFLAQAVTDPRDSVGVNGWGHDHMTAARACVEAWREAHQHPLAPTPLVHLSELQAERANAERLAEALRAEREDRLRRFGFSFRATDDALSAHDARRGKEGA